MQFIFIVRYTQDAGGWEEGSFDHIIASHPIVIMTGEGGGGGEGELQNLKSSCMGGDEGAGGEAAINTEVFSPY